MTKVELFNAKSCGQKLEKGMTIEVKAIGSFDDVDKDGNPVKASALVASNGDVYTAISSTIYNSLEMLDEILKEQGTVTVEVIESNSNNGRAFKQLKIVE